jgi:hypothetical protein
VRTARRLSAIGLFIAMGLGHPAAAQAPPGPAPVMDMGELMSLFLEPLFSELKEALDKPPQDRKQWAAIYQAAIRLAEADNLLFIRTPGRHTNDPAWAPAAAAARQAAADIATATFVALRNVRAADFAPLKAQLANVADTCNACHRALKVDARTVRP